MRHGICTREAIMTRTRENEADRRQDPAMSEARRAAQLRAETRGSVRWLVADNPSRLNAFTAAMWAALPRLIAEAERDPEVRVIVLSGAGDKAFSAGADISEFETARTAANAAEYDALNNAAFEAVLRASKPTIAAVQGFCLGGGLELAVCCDLRLASDSALFSVPAAKLGIGYNPRWIRPMLAVVSPARARELLYTGRRFTAAEALAMGLVNSVHGTAELTAAVTALADDIAANAPLSVLAAKRAIEAFADHPQTPDLAALDRLVDACFSSEDYIEGRRAFMEKRKPRFRGR
jgi:enoyl-CoA hydratase